MKVPAMNAEMLERIAAWRRLPEAEQTRQLRERVVDEVIGNMAMEGQPVSKQWGSAVQSSIG